MKIWRRKSRRIRKNGNLRRRMENASIRRRYIFLRPIADNMSNRLKNQSSPYLRQHAENPVDWYPWCAEAFEKARREEKPVFLSIGYSACHWCHVMAHESFEDEETAELLNRHFVSIKVDREERPDIDSVYMEVCQALTGSGGWPMSIFLTAEQKPFYAGTYFPPESRYGMPGFKELLNAIAEQWKCGRDGILNSAEQILSGLFKREEPLTKRIDNSLPEEAAVLFEKSYDNRYGGFGQAPKFPMPHNLIFLTLYGKQTGDKKMLLRAVDTLEKMRRGGIFDQIGYGFSRYSTDRYYLVPHFEKMLYDNALLIIACAAAYQASGRRQILAVAERTAAWIFREMTGPNGEFYSAQDADSDGEEGKFYVFSKREIEKVLGKQRADVFCEYYNITEEGNFEGKNIPNLLFHQKPAEAFEEEREELYRYRKSRGRLHLDDKVLTSWNAFAIIAMTALYRVTGKRRYLSAAEAACRFIETNLTEGSLLYVGYRGGKTAGYGFLDDYAGYAAALLSVYEATGEAFRLKRAKQLLELAEAQFADKNGGYFLYGNRNDRLITRPKETYDGAIPSGNSLMAWCLVRISQITGSDVYEERAAGQLAFLSGEAARYPAGHSLFLTALLLFSNPPEKVTVVLAKGDSIERTICAFPLSAVLEIHTEETEAYRLLNGKTTYYICKNHTCYPPTNNAVESSGKTRRNPI